MKVHPHAFVVLTPDGVGVLVHLGIDTVHLGGEGFTLHRAEGDDVARARRWCRSTWRLVRGKGLSAVCPVVVLDSPAGSCHRTGTHHRWTPASSLFAYSTDR
jgi:phosphotransferase system IIA component